MRAYKFRSPDSIEFALDIILNERLHCADWRELNDPMEGKFTYSYTPGEEETARRIARAIGRSKSGYRVCSLSRSFQSHLLWAHYANGFHGLAIEVDLPDDEPNIQPVSYRGVFEMLDIAEHARSDLTARRILFSKYHEWEYEEEIRILNTEPFYPIPGGVRRVIVGHRMNPALSDTLQLVCERLGVPFSRVGIGDEGLDADYVQPLVRSRFRSRGKATHRRDGTRGI